MRRTWKTLIAICVAIFAIAFSLGGGLAVAAFTSVATGNATLSADTILVQLGGGNDGQGDITCTLLQPGYGCTPNVTISDSSSSENVTVALGPVTGTASAITQLGLSDVDVSLSDSLNGTFFNGTLWNALGNQNANPGPTITVGTLPASTQDTVTFTFNLASSTGNEWNGASVTIPFTFNAA